MKLYGELLATVLYSKWNCHCRYELYIEHSL